MRTYAITEHLLNETLKYIGLSVSSVPVGQVVELINALRTLPPVPESPVEKESQSATAAATATDLDSST